MRKASRSLLIVGTIALAACGRKSPGPLDPADALKSFRLSEDYRVELFAAEPDVLDPVELVFDESGRAFVAEMLDLPDNPPPGKPARGRIRMLEDTDGDGRADRGRVFAENLLQASGLMPWKGGLIVTAAPEILYLKDTDGDGRADLREVWFTGFWQGNPEAQVTNPRLAIDNWIYFSNTGNEGLIRSPKHPEHAPVQVRGADFRYHPVRGVFEAASGPAQFGSTFDDWGNRFVTQNTIHLRHVVVPMEYIRRAGLLETPAVLHDVYGDFERRMYPLTGPQEWRVKRTELRQKRYDELKTGRVEHAAGYITGAAGSTIYSGDAWPESARGSVFTGDASANLVRRDVLRPDGVTFSARPAKEGVEFLASTDPWFRPAHFANAPDGNLYLVDMQREFIETPLSVPEELRKKMNFYSGDTLGRIYRIAANQARVTRPLKANLGAMSGAELVKLLDHPNGWHRETAQRLLIERQDAAAEPLLRTTAAQGASPQSRLRALWTLEGMGKLGAGDIAGAARDPDAHVRQHAVRLSERLTSPAAIEKLASDPDLRVRYQLAWTLGMRDSPAAKAALVDLAARDSGDRWMRTALVASTSNRPVDFYRSLSQRGSPVAPELTRAVASVAGSRKSPSEIAALISLLERTRQTASGLAGLAAGLRLSGARGLRAAGIDAALERAMRSSIDAERGAAWEVARFFDLPALAERASRDALSGELPVPARVRALSLLRGATYPRAAAVVDKALASNAPAEVQAAAIATLSSFDDSAVARTLLRHWKGYGPEARVRAVGALLATRERVPQLLAAIERGDVEASAVDAAARGRLFESREPGVADRARKLFRAAAGDRAETAARYMDAARLTGDVGRGKLAFAERCARCHMPRRTGGRVGPDLSGINNKTKEELIEAILNPSAAIESRFVNYVVTTRDGRMYDGVLAGETAAAVTLRGGAEEDVTIARAEIAEIRASAVSLMPDELEEGMSRQTLADIIAYLRGGL